MDASSGSFGDSGDKQGRSQNSSEGSSSFNFTPDHEAQLEAFFKLCPHPDETQLDLMGKDLGLEAEQIHLWFQTRIQGDHEASESEPESPNTELATNEKTKMLEIADAAIKELLKLMTTDKPFWTKSNDIVGFVLVPESYDNLFPRATRVINLASSNIHQESSKDSIVVKLGGMQLVDMFLDSEKWASIFPTIVSKAKTLKVFDMGSPQNQSGALQLMYGEIHALSPLLPSREFIFLRYCQQVEDGLWVIADVSLDDMSLVNFEGRIPDSPVRKFPSGCMIKHLPNGFSKVTWIEHVEVHEKRQIDRRYKELVFNNFAYGANRWLFALYKICEKIACSSIQYQPGQGAEREIESRRGRANLMELSTRMVQSFCNVLNLRECPHFTSFNVGNRNELYVCLEKNTAPSQPEGFIGTAILSISLPVLPQNVFYYLKELNTRPQWDILSFEKPVNEIAHIPISDTSRVSVIKTFNPIDNNVLIFQESCIDPLGAYIVFAPLDETNGHMIMDGTNSSTTIPVLPSGFMISGDSRAIGDSKNPHRSGGSLLTACYQILVCHDSLSLEMKIQTMNSLTTLLITTIHKITSALGCPNCW